MILHTAWDGTPLRNLKVKLGCYPLLDENITSNKFYQFALDYKQVLKDLERLGFKLRYKKAIGGIKGLKDEVASIKSPLQKLFDYRGKSFLVKGLKFFLDYILLSSFAGHMMLLVLQLEK